MRGTLQLLVGLELEPPLDDRHMMDLRYVYFVQYKSDIPRGPSGIQT